MLKNSKDNDVNGLEQDIKKVDDKNEKKEKKKSVHSLFLSLVFKRMKEDKLYLLSFIITIVFFVFFGLYNISESEGLYNSKKDKNEITSSKVESKDEVKVPVDSGNELDIKDYIGIYSKEVILDVPLVINDKCSISSYKIAYQIIKDKSIRKYFVNDCIGVVEMWNDKLSYVSNGGARYISANKIHYLFAASSMKELDGDTFKIDDDLSNLKNNVKLANASVYFENNDIIVMTYDNLYLINDNEGINVLKDYQSNGGQLLKKVYKSDTKRQFNFIVFNNEDNLNCYDVVDDSFVDGNSYKIYTIKYNNETGKFNNPKEIISRDKSAGCDVFNDDLVTLEE